MSSLLILLIIIAVLIFVFVGIYNGLVKLRNTSEQAWSDVDVQLKRRYDLVPNLVETVKGYASHEKETFEKVVQARNQAMQATSPEDKSQAENFLQSTLKSHFDIDAGGCRVAPGAGAGLPNARSRHWSHGMRGGGGGGPRSGARCGVQGESQCAARAACQ